MALYSWSVVRISSPGRKSSERTTALTAPVGIRDEGEVVRIRADEFPERGATRGKVAVQLARQETDRLRLHPVSPVALDVEHGSRAGSERAVVEECHGRIDGASDGRRPTACSNDGGYTAAVGAVDTMDTFFELLNAGDREAAVGLMAENAEMRIHVGDSAQTLRGVDRVGGWFLRGDSGLKMIPGEVRDTGNTYEADVLVVRPGAPSLHLDATFRVEAGKITSINLAPR